MWLSFDVAAQLCSIIFENGGNMFLLERKPVVLGIRKPKNVEFTIILLTFCSFLVEYVLKKTLFFDLEGFAILHKHTRSFITQIRIVYKTTVIF